MRDPMTPAWNDTQINRFLFRVTLFVQRGLDVLAAELLGDRLATRDSERDDRRVCLECASLSKTYCYKISRNHKPVADVLQRCEFFTFSKP